jgi:hypothetical protein
MQLQSNIPLKFADMELQSGSIADMKNVNGCPLLQIIDRIDFSCLIGHM